MLRTVSRVLFWFGLGVLVHDYAHALWEAGGFREILSPQGGWFGLVLVITGWFLRGGDGMFEALKAAYRQRPKAICTAVFLVVSFAMLHMFSVWQLDIICVGPVWHYGWRQPEPRYADQPFQCWLWKTTIGEAYDVLLFLNFVSFYGVIAAFVALMHLLLKVVTKR